MGYNTGTSVVGSQLLIEDVVETDLYFYLVVSETEEFPPSRAGFLYLVLYDSTTLNRAAVVDTRVIYRPGIYFIRQPIGVSTVDQLKVWAEWNAPGLSWQMITF